MGGDGGCNGTTRKVPPEKTKPPTRLVAIPAHQKAGEMYGSNSFAVEEQGVGCRRIVRLRSVPSRLWGKTKQKSHRFPWVLNCVHLYNYETILDNFLDDSSSNMISEQRPRILHNRQTRKCRRATVERAQDTKTTVPSTVLAVCQLHVGTCEI